MGAWKAVGFERLLFFLQSADINPAQPVDPNPVDQRRRQNIVRLQRARIPLFVLLQAPKKYYMQPYVSLCNGATHTYMEYYVSCIFFTSLDYDYYS